MANEPKNIMTWHPYNERSDAPKVGASRKEPYLCKVCLVSRLTGEPLDYHYEVLSFDENGVFYYGNDDLDAAYDCKVIAWTEIVG